MLLYTYVFRHFTLLDSPIVIDIIINFDYLPLWDKTTRHKIKTWNELKILQQLPIYTENIKPYHKPVYRNYNKQ